MRLLSLLIFLSLLGCTERAPEAEPQTDGVPLDSVFSYETAAPYVATPQSVVERMLKVASVGPDDVVYDLGSGDGRMVLTAVQQFGARGVGVEIVPELVRKARSNARLAGAADRATFIRQDLFKTDLSDATVVAIYLLPEVLEKLRPTFRAELDPGDRIVSHNYTIPGWPPDRTVPAAGDHVIYLWTMPVTADSTAVTP